MKVFLGSWKREKKGWVHVDMYPQNDFTIEDDARTLKTFRNGSVTELQAIHLLEHISHRDVRGMFKHWLRVLQPEGRAVVEVPDILAISKAYIAWHEAGGEWEEEAALGLVRRPAKDLSHRSWQTLFGGTHQHRGHWNGSYWDAMRLQREMKEAGFRDVVAEKPVESLPTWGPSIRVVGTK